MKRAIIIVTIVILVAGGALFFTRRLQAAGPAEKTQFKLAKAERGEVKKTVSATGTLKPWKTVDIKSKAGGRVDELLVDVGDEVKKGQVLARIDPADTLLSVNTAQADIEAARAREQQNREAYELQVRQSEIAIKNAQASLEAAQASYEAAKQRLERARKMEKAQPVMTAASIAQAEANYKNAVQVRAQLDATLAQERAAAQSAYDQAMANLRNAEANLNRQRSLLAKGFVSQQVVDTAQANYEVASAQVKSAKEKLNTIEAEQRAEIDAADERVRQAKAQWENAKAQAVEDDNSKISVKEAEATVKQWEAQIAQARTQLAQAIANQRNNAIRRYDIANARASITRAQASLTNAKITLDQTIVRAPSDGVVLVKYVEQGTIISSALSFAATGNNILQIGDVTRMYVDVTVDETDIANVDVDQAVDVQIEAYPGIPFEGKVTRIDPQAQVEQNVTTVHVRVEIDNSSPTFRLLKPGMNATCEFIIDKKENVVRVPPEAIRTDDKGRFVEIGQGGKPVPPDPKSNSEPDPDMLIDVKVTRRDVEVGLEGNEFVEIVSGLQEGESVVVQKIEPTPKTASSPFGGGFGGGMRGFARSRQQQR